MKVAPPTPAPGALRACRPHTAPRRPTPTRPIPTTPPASTRPGGSVKAKLDLDPAVLGSIPRNTRGCPLPNGRLPRPPSREKAPSPTPSPCSGPGSRVGPTVCTNSADGIDVGIRSPRPPSPERPPGIHVETGPLPLKDPVVGTHKRRDCGRKFRAGAPESIAVTPVAPTPEAAGAEEQTAQRG